MNTPLNPKMKATFAPPVMEARRWIEGVTFPADRPLINVSQAAPVEVPPLALRQAIADAAINTPQAHLYGPVLGNGDLRAQIAHDWSSAYGGHITPAQVAITAGCNQAFTAIMSTLAGAGDAVILPSPWYFNHKMWADMNGVDAIPLKTGDSLLPDVDAARALITPAVKAILLVSPNNPGGVEYPPALLSAFYDLAREHGIALVVDETYRDFDSRDRAPHDLFTRPDWDQTLIQLYSFSKAYRLTGHRVGAVVCAVSRLVEVEKYLDTVSICPNQIGQMAALWGMQNLGDWLAGERAEILRRRAAIIDGFAPLAAKGWRLLGAGAYFAYVEHPFSAPSNVVAKALVERASILCLPGTMFTPDGDADGARQIRFAFANIDVGGISTLFARLAAFEHP